ncbi:hypothetical protein [Amycolatopsis sp. H20-H5]|uniref:hypothetical protein n=1 Tax=Amycolatopsis sp. H20-H5 TaxID=3046309 RepID=UPI002DB72280|nr:hypothetical protein [Amycolatopsis sp. H20-H5]MEC3974174.1 hypothetical protein [Amycolatopsis sp. H20-H5]
MASSAESQGRGSRRLEQIVGRVEGSFVADLDSGRTTIDHSPPYLHDLPLFAMIPALRADIAPLPDDLLPRFFHWEW